MDNLPVEEAVKAIYNELVGQTFAVLGMAIAKISLGIFLLRIVVEQWHRISIWISMVSLAMVSVLTAVLLWTQKSPSRATYDPRVQGRVVVAITPFSILLGSEFVSIGSRPGSGAKLTCWAGWCAAVDFYFALLPWIFIWKLNMRFAEKISIACSLSLGFMYVLFFFSSFFLSVFLRFWFLISSSLASFLAGINCLSACICGIIRTIDLSGLGSANYTGKTPKVSQPIMDTDLRIVSSRGHGRSHHLVCY